MTARSLRVLLEGLIDYAGLFPPAGLPLDRAVENYSRYRASELAWALGRFVVPAERVAEVPEEFPLSVLGEPVGRAGPARRGDDAGAAGGRALPGHPGFETKAATPDDVARIASKAEGVTVYVEITDLALLGPIARHGLRAKVRTGGITADAFPPVERVAEFVRACRAAGIPFKATAGLHHPLRCVKPLTYEPDAPMGTMHGFLNVFLAALFEGDEEEVLRETSAAAFSFDDEGIGWRGRRTSVEEVRALRGFAHSFGSCSFEEPLSDLSELGLISTLNIQH